jgi:cholesterol transport system auxiliary component
MRLLRYAAALALAASLAGCAGSPPVVFDLDAANPTLTETPRAILRIRQPTASGDLNSDRILVRGGPHGLAVMAGARWADLLPFLVRARLTTTFQNARGLRAVAEDAAVAYNYDVETDLRAFELDADTKQIDIEIGVKVVSATSGRAVASRVFATHAAVASTEPGVVAAALDRALSGVMLDIVKFVASSV